MDKVLVFFVDVSLGLGVVYVSGWGCFIFGVRSFGVRFYLFGLGFRYFVLLDSYLVGYCDLRGRRKGWG